MTPAFNERSNLPALHQRLSESLKHLEWEWVIVDDHSTDDTFAVIERLVAGDPRVRGFRLARNSGSHIAITCGLQQSRGHAAALVVSDALAERLAGFKAVLDDRSLATALIAIQGPRALDVLQPHTDVDIAGLRYYAIAEGHVAGMDALVARTGYTGEDGFEVFVDWGRAGELWDVLLPAVEAAEGLPVGLGARDTLRLEAGMPLYGNELDRTTNPFEANLGRVVKLDKANDFVGRTALEKVASAGPARRLVGLVMEGRGIARHGYPVHAGEQHEHDHGEAHCARA